jgi:hypothetical protein
VTPLRLAPLAIGALMLAGCQTPPPTLYHWGAYEASIYRQLAAPDKGTPEQMATALEADVQKAAAANRPVHPGLHAQLGYLYHLTGRDDLARQEFETEKRLFPESAVFMDRMLGNAPSPAKK